MDELEIRKNYIKKLSSDTLRNAEGRQNKGNIQCI